jgi:hypothetical protein
MGQNLRDTHASCLVAHTYRCEHPAGRRITWRDWLVGAWKNVCEPRVAMALLTSTLVLGWMGNLAGISAPDIATLRHPVAVYHRIGGWANRLYGDAVRSYYSSPIVNAIQCQIHSRIEQFRENS